MDGERGEKNEGGEGRVEMGKEHWKGLGVDLVKLDMCCFLMVRFLLPGGL